MALLELKNVTKYYNGVTPALADVSFTVREGEFVSVIGPSVAGKSTLLRCINRMIESTGGEISFDGVVVSKLRKRDLRQLRTKIGMIFQHYNLVDRLTVIENVLSTAGLATSQRWLVFWGITVRRKISRRTGSSRSWA